MHVILNGQLSENSFAAANAFVL